MSDSGRLVIVSGPSGVGKDTVLDAWAAQNPRVRRVVAHTTRDPRPGEVDGVDYHFVSRQAFEANALAGAYLEAKLVHGNGYATPLADAERMQADGQIAILKIDVQGAAEVRAKRPEVRTIFLAPPSWEELERRIRGRGTEDEASVRRRLQAAQEEMEQARFYHHVIVNESVAATVAELERLVLE